jgi:signal transduction histidine kinase
MSAGEKPASVRCDTGKRSQSCFGEKGITVTTLVELPEAVPCTVLGDEARLHQILGNSPKFTPDGGSVTVHLRRTRANAIIVVKDTGKGISPEFLPHIFKRFSQDEASSRENGGLGLGLAICKHLVELHGGSIRAESAGPGRGAVIEVKFRTIRPVRRLPNGASDRWSFI